MRAPPRYGMDSLGRVLSKKRQRKWPHGSFPSQKTMDELPDVAGERIRAMRMKRGMTHEELGRAMHSHCSSISKFERGEKLPSVRTLFQLAAVLRCSTDYLLGRSDHLDLY